MTLDKNDHSRYLRDSVNFTARFREVSITKTIAENKLGKFNFNLREYSTTHTQEIADLLTGQGYDITDVEEILIHTAALVNFFDRDVSKASSYLELQILGLKSFSDSRLCPIIDELRTHLDYFELLFKANENRQNSLSAETTGEKPWNTPVLVTAGVLMVGSVALSFYYQAFPAMIISLSLIASVAVLFSRKKEVISWVVTEQRLRDEAYSQSSNFDVEDYVKINQIVNKFVHISDEELRAENTSKELLKLLQANVPSEVQFD